MTKEIITIATDTGRKMEYEKIANINLIDKRFLILKPVDQVEGGSVIFEAVKSGYDKYDLNLVTDVDVIDSVIQEYENICSKIRGNGDIAVQ